MALLPHLTGLAARPWRKPTRSVLAVLGISLLVLVSLFSNVYKLAGITEVVPDFETTLIEQRFDGLRQLLPPHGVVGYVTDKEGPTYVFANTDYMIVQYVLAPLIVDYSPHHALVVGTITQPTTDLKSFLQKSNVILLKNLGNGVLLLRGPEK